MAKYRIKGLPNNMFQEGGTNSKKDKWGRSADSKWYGFDPKTKQWTLGKPKEAAVKKETAKPKPRWEHVIEKKDKWGRPESDKWYGFDPKTKKYTLGEWKGYTAGSKNEALNKRYQLNERLKKIKEYEDWNENADWTDRLAQSFGFGPQNPNYSTGLNPSNSNDLLTYFTPGALTGSAAATAVAPYAERILGDVKKLGNLGLKNLVPSSAKNAATIQKYVRPVNIGNAARAKTAYDLGTKYLPNLIKGEDQAKNLADVTSSVISLSPLRSVYSINQLKNIYSTGKYGSENLNDPRNLENQYKFYSSLAGLSNFKGGGSIPKAQFGAQTNPLYSESNNLLIKAAKKKAPKSLAKDVRPTIKKQIADNEIATRKKAEADYIKAVATGQVSALNKPAADAALANAELEREHARLQQQYYDDIYEQEEQKFQDKPLSKWTQYGLPILDLFDTGTKTGQFVRDFTADPLNVVEEGIWDQDYLPNRSAILRDPSHPLYGYYMKRSGMDKSPLSQTLQYVNPFSSAAEATVAIRKGDYAEALKQYGEGLGKSAGIAVAMEALPTVMGTTVALPEAIGAATGLTGTTTVGGVLGAGFAGYGLTKLPTTAKKIATAIETGNKEDWREAVNETGLNLLDFIGTGEFFESTRPFAGALSAEEGTAALLNRAGELAKEEKLLGELKPEIGQVFDRDYYREQMAQLDQENPFDWSTIDEADDAFGSQQLYDDLSSIESDMQNLDMRIDDLFINEQYYEPEVFKRLLNEAQEERQLLSETYDQLAGYKNAVNDFEAQQVAEEAGASGSGAFDDREYLNSQLGQDQELDRIINSYNTYDDRITALKEELNFGIDPSDIDAATELESQIDDLISLRDQTREFAADRLVNLRSGSGPTVIPETPAMYNNARPLDPVSPGAVNTPNATSSFDLSRITTPPVTPTAAAPTVDRATELNDIFTATSATSGATATEIKPFTFSQETLNQIDHNTLVRLSNTNNPTELVERLNARLQGGRINREAYDELTNALFNALEQQGRSQEYISDLKNIRSLVENDPSILRSSYTGSDRSLSNIQDWYQNMKDSELDQLDWMHQYSADDINNLYNSLDSNEARRALLNQVYDDYRYMVNGEVNPNNRPFNIQRGQVTIPEFKPSEFSNTNIPIPPEDVDLLRLVTQDGGSLFTDTQGLNNRQLLGTPERLKNLKAIQKTEYLDEMIIKYQELEKLLTNPNQKHKVAEFVEDLKSTKWLRTEYTKELKAAGLSPKEIEGASIMSYQGAGPQNTYKMLVNKDGEVVGTLSLVQKHVDMGNGVIKDVMDISYSAVNYKFHPYSVGKGHSQFKTWTEAEEHLLKESLSPEYKDLAGDIVKAKSKKDLLDLEDAIYEKRLNTFPEEVRDKSFIKARARDEVSEVMKKINESKKQAKVKIEQIETNNNNRWGEALYRASHHGLKDTRGPVVTHEHFVNTDLPDAVTGEIITRRRAYDYWYSQIKQMNEQGVPKAQHLFPNKPTGHGSGNYIMIMRKRGGNIPKLSKFIR